MRGYWFKSEQHRPFRARQSAHCCLIRDEFMGPFGASFLFHHHLTMFSIFDSYFPSVRTVYVVSDSQLADLKRRQAEEELASLASQRESLDKAYQSRVDVLEARVQEVTQQIAALNPVKEEAKEEAKA